MLLIIYITKNTAINANIKAEQKKKNRKKDCIRPHVR